jgi:hypothetical protein
VLGHSVPGIVVVVVFGRRSAALAAVTDADSAHTARLMRRLVFIRGPLLLLGFGCGPASGIVVRPGTGNTREKKISSCDRADMCLAPTIRVGLTSRN